MSTIDSNVAPVPLYAIAYTLGAMLFGLKGFGWNQVGRMDRSPQPKLFQIQI